MRQTTVIVYIRSTFPNRNEIFRKNIYINYNNE